MSRRIEKVNKQIQRAVGEILQTKAELTGEAMVTVAAVDTAPSLQVATVWLSVYPPENARLVAEQLDKQMYDLQGAFNKAVVLKPQPRLKLKIYDSNKAAI